MAGRYINAKGFSDIRRAHVLREMAARDAYLQWPAEAQRLGLTPAETFQQMSGLASYGWGLQQRAQRQARRNRAEQIREAGRQMDHRLLRQRGLR